MSEGREYVWQHGRLSSWRSRWTLWLYRSYFEFWITRSVTWLYSNTNLFMFLTTFLFSISTWNQTIIHYFDSRFDDFNLKGTIPNNPCDGATTLKVLLKWKIVFDLLWKSVFFFFLYCRCCRYVTMKSRDH